MNIYGSSHRLVDNDNPLGFTYPCYKDMYDTNLIFAYKGSVTSDLVSYVLQIMGEKLEEERANKKVTKKVFNVMVECLKNVYSYEDNEEALRRYEHYDPNAILMVRKEDDSYLVTTGNYILNSKVHELQSQLERINDLQLDEIRTMYQSQLMSEDPGERGLTGLGILDIARKSRQRLVYHFEYVNENYSFFSLEARISKNHL